MAGPDQFVLARYPLVDTWLASVRGCCDYCHCECGCTDSFLKKHLNFLKSDREREIVYDVPYMQNLKKNDTNEHIYKAETGSQTQRTSLRLLGEGRGEREVREFGMDMYTLLYLKLITNKDLLYHTGNSTQSSIIALWLSEGKDGGRDS